MWSRFPDVAAAASTSDAPFVVTEHRKKLRRSLAPSASASRLMDPALTQSCLGELKELTAVRAEVLSRSPTAAHGRSQSSARAGSTSSGERSHKPARGFITGGILATRDALYRPAGCCLSNGSEYSRADDVRRQREEEQRAKCVGPVVIHPPSITKAKSAVRNDVFMHVSDGDALAQQMKALQERKVAAAAKGSASLSRFDD